MARWLSKLFRPLLASLTASILMAGSLVRPTHAIAAAGAAEDFSILFPLPAQDDDSGDALLSPGTQAKHGTLLPYSIYERIPLLVTTGHAKEREIYDALRVVGVRLDPCFESMDKDPSYPVKSGDLCKGQRQVRLVLQPLVNRLGAWKTEDAAVHVFYSLPPAEFFVLVRQIAKIRSKYRLTGAPNVLGVHQGLALKGLRSAYARTLLKLLLGHVGWKRMRRVTFMTIGGRNSIWQFGGFDLVPAPDAVLTDGSDAALKSIEPIRIANVKPERQPLRTDEKNTILQRIERLANDSLLADVSPLPDDMPDDASSFYRIGRHDTPEWKTIKPQLERLAKVENPNFTSPRSVDCASCHAAESARLWLESKAPDAGQAEALKKIDGRFGSSRLRVSDEIARAANNRNTQNFRAFGYFDGAPNSGQPSVPAISQRALNETDWAMMQAELFGKLYRKP